MKNKGYANFCRASKVNYGRCASGELESKILKDSGSSNRKMMPQWNGLFIVYSRHPGKNACVYAEKGIEDICTQGKRARTEFHFV